ncbi:ATP-binding cassette domain-containing protein [Streptomyces coeruleorubidus]|uniref:ATP-binding cassette domain-containing protein n=1 Tax=Streptomyces coeruleorubidus TaxID=116188 RepID=UPI003F53F917
MDRDRRRLHRGSRPVRRTNCTSKGSARPTELPTCLRGLELAILPGTSAAVLGPSGCGKTTMLRVVAGFLHADAGTIRPGGRLLNGSGVHFPSERRRNEDSVGAVGGTVTDVSYYGHDAMVAVAVDGHDTPIGIRVAGPIRVRPGEATGVRVEGEAGFHP